MAKKPKLTTDDLISYIDREISASFNYNSKIQQERTKALKYYAREPFGNEKRGRSTYVSADVQETISWALPQILKIFSGDDIIKFTTNSPQYKDNANAATAYATTVLKKWNQGFLILHNWFHDALLQKNGFIKVSYDKRDRIETEEYEGLSDAELAILLQDSNVEPIEHEQKQIVDPMTGQVIQSIHDVKIKRTLAPDDGFIRIENVPVEEVIVSKLARSVDLDEAPFVAHRVKRSISWLREQGYKVADDINDGTENGNDYALEKMEREFQDGSYYNEQTNVSPVDPSMRLVWVTEAYFRVDYNRDGIAELRRVLKVGSSILENEECYCQPFISTSPLPQPHRFNGQSLADLVTDLQLLKSMTTRAMLDSFAFNINPSKAVDITKVVDINDLLDTNPGNYIRMRGDIGNAVTTLPSSGIGGDALSLLQYIDDQSESRTGVSKQTQGIDKNAFNKTATGTQIMMSASQEKLALIVRIFAETGVGPLYKKIIELASEYSNAPELIEINQEFKEVHPTQWKNLKSISINIGTGNLDKEKESANIQSLIQIQQSVQGSQDPFVNSLIDPIKIYNSIANYTKSLGYSNANEYFNNPNSPEYQQVVQMNMQKMQSQNQPPPDPNASIAEAQKLKDQQDLLIKTATFELDKLKADREFELKKYEMQLKYELELLKLPQSPATGVVASQVEQVGNLNPSNELLPESEIHALTRVLNNEGANQGQGSLYAQILQKNEMDNQMQEAERQRAKAESDAVLKVIGDLTANMNAPKKVIRDADGKVIGIAPDTGE